VGASSGAREKRFDRDARKPQGACSEGLVGSPELVRLTTPTVQVHGEEVAIALRPEAKTIRSRWARRRPAHRGEEVRQAVTLPRRRPSNRLVLPSHASR